MCSAIVCDLPTNPSTHRPTHPPADPPPTRLLSIIEQHESDYLALEMRLQAALRRAEEAEGRLDEAEEMAAAAREAAGVEVVVTVGEEARPNVNASANVDRGAAAEERAAEAALLAAQADARAVAAEAAAAAAVGASGLAGAANVEEADTGGAWEAAAASAGRRQEQLSELAGDIAEVTGDDAEVTGDSDEMTRRTEQAPYLLACLPCISTSSATLPRMPPAIGPQPGSSPSRPLAPTPTLSPSRPSPSPSPPLAHAPHLTIQGRAESARDGG